MIIHSAKDQRQKEMDHYTVQYPHRPT